MQDVCQKHGHPTLGWQVIDWAETYLCHGPGDVQGEPLVFDDEMTSFLLCAYALHEDGRRRYDECLLSRPKGRAKTELAAAVVCAEALGPVRFAGWNADGEPVGAPVTYPFIRCLATEEDQSGNTYGAAAFMFSHGEVANEHPVDLGRDWQSSTRIYLPGGGEIRPSTAASASKDGGKESFAVADEPHLYVLPENRRMYDTVFRNMAKRKKAAPWMLSTSTMFAPGQESTAEKLHRAAKKNDRLLLDHKGARRHLEFTDDAGLLTELEYVYGDGWAWMDQARLLKSVQDDEADESDRRRYFLNEPWKGDDAWLDVRDWDACKAEKTIEPGEAVVLGFDGAQYDDSTALICCRISDGHLFVIGIWEKPLGQDGVGWEVDRQLVEDVLEDAFTRYDVRLMWPDPWGDWRPYVDRWAARWPGRVVEFDTRHKTKMCRALELIAADVKNHALTHDGSKVLAQHVANARKRISGDLYTISKDQRKSPRKIDAAVAATLAYAARAEALDMPAPSSGRVYAFR
jgi:phage terminase large subunit-like protein